MTRSIVVAALYKFVSLPDYVALREPLLQTLLDNGIKGTLLLAEEGINGTVSGTRESIDALLAWLRRDPRLDDVDHKESYCDEQPFYRTKVKLKKEIVTLGVPGVDPNRRVGTYVEPQDWNALISDPEVLLIDTRNDYEVAIGTFEGAVDPRTKSFREFPEYVKSHYDPAKYKKVAMFCTGGIRCEKASSYMLGEGFEEVYHLKGGILKYLEEVPQEQTKWRGDCFVFDNRVTVRHDLSEGDYDQCHACRNPISVEDRQSEFYSPGVSCPHCWDSLPEKTRESARERQKQIDRQKLDALLGYCETVRCRRQVLLEYFADALPQPCGNCDTCLEPVEAFDGTELARKALSCVYRTGQRFGVGHVIDVLTGSETDRVRQLGHDRLSTWGIGRDLSKQEWKSVFVLNTVDGCIPSDLGAGNSDELEEERRLLYVAMTRAKDSLNLVVPQRFFTHGQTSTGDRHVYASRTRFIPNSLLAYFERRSWPLAIAPQETGAQRQARLDVGARMRGMWR